MPGAFKLDHLQPFKPISSPKFFHFFTFMLERPILITQERGSLKMGKGNSPNLRETPDIGCLGHSNWTICSPLSSFYPPNFPLLYWWGGNSPNLSEVRDIGCLGHSNWTICSLSSQFHPPNFFSLALLYCRGLFLLPQREEA